MSKNLYLPLILCVVSIVMAENFDTHKDSSEVRFEVDEVSGLKSFEYRERYMHIMSRFCLSFVNVASKVFLFKEAAV